MVRVECVWAVDDLHYLMQMRTVCEEIGHDTVHWRQITDVGADVPTRHDVQSVQWVARLGVDVARKVSVQ